MTRWPRTLRGRLALWYAAVLTVAFLAFSLTVYFVAEREEEAEARKEGTAPDAEDTIGPRVLLALALGLPAALVVAIAGGLWIGRRELAAIAELARGAAALDAADLRQRLPSHAGGAEELAQLEHALNGMLARIEDSVQGMRRFTADASHELRTPIAVMRSDLEIGLRRPRTEEAMRVTMERALEELTRMTRLIDGLLLLARSDAGELPVVRVAVSLEGAVREAMEPYLAIAEARGVALSLEHADALDVAGDALWIGRAVANLVDNACKFTASGGAIRIAISREGQVARVLVEDTGRGMSEEERARAFERFFRGVSVRGNTEGFGLGLAIATQAVVAMGGTLGAAANPGGGSRFWIELPLFAA